ncbi:MAG TPA: cysteine desulfurase, partial [Firmicutes bacterium]|nr:cysteine desulfurase [Bacillota bacterium]
MTEIYLDNCATTRPYDEVVEYMSKLHTNMYGNPSSLHYKGIEAEKLLKKARRDIAHVLKVKENEVYFTSGGTEANNLAIRGSAYRYRRQGNHLVTTAIEHPSVINSFRRLQEEGFKVDYLPVNSQGYISLAELDRLITPDTILVSINHVNNEIGTVEPLERIGTLIKQRNPNTLLHVDGVQSFCKLPLNLNTWQADLFSCSAHKIHGPKGVGALWVKPGTMLTPLLEGGGQEQDLRPGTENVAGTAGFGLAAILSEQQRERAASSSYRLKQKLYQGLLDQNLEIELNGPPLT